MPEYERKLPHFHPEAKHLFVTWRLWGSLPAAPPDDPAVYPTPGHAFVAKDKLLDRQATGPRWLNDPAIADLVSAAILTGASEKHYYDLLAWCIMPNHVHMLVFPLTEVETFMKWLKGSTARRANLTLGRTSQPFWQQESYDHYLRTTDRLDRCIAYIEENPVSAGLASCADQWPWSSAGRKPLAG